MRIPEPTEERVVLFLDGSGWTTTEGKGSGSKGQGGGKGD